MKSMQANYFSGKLIGNDLRRGYLVNPALLHKSKEERKERVAVFSFKSQEEVSSFVFKVIGDIVSISHVVNQTSASSSS